MYAAQLVIFENPDICASKGSSVNFRCSYNYGEEETTTGVAWHKGTTKGANWIRLKLANFPSLHNRSEYLGDMQHDCSLAIHDLQEIDTGYYYFHFDTNAYGRRSKKPLYLSVTGKITVNSVSPFLRFLTSIFLFLIRDSSQCASLLHGETRVECMASLSKLLPKPCYLVQRWRASHQNRVPGWDWGCWKLHMRYGRRGVSALRPCNSGRSVYVKFWLFEFKMANINIFPYCKLENSGLSWIFIGNICHTYSVATIDHQRPSLL